MTSPAASSERDAAVRLDAQWRVQSFDVAAPAILRCPADGLFGAHISGLLPGSGLGSAAEAELKQRGCVRRTVRLQRDAAILDVVACRLDAGFVVNVKDHAAAALADRVTRLTMRLDLATSAAGLGFWELDLITGTVVWDGTKYRGAPRSSYELTIEGFLSLVHTDDRERIRKAIEDATTTGVPYVERFRFVFPGEAVRWVEARGGLERNASGEAVAFSGVSHDITEQVQAEEQRDTLQTAVQRREDMIAVVGHELRQPLAAMLEAVQAMAQPGDRSVTERACRTIDRQVRELIRIVEDLAQSSALQRGGVASSAAPLDLNDIVRRVAEAASSQTARRGISLAVQMHDAPVWVSGDAPQLQRVFANLMDNAVKYTKPGGRIDVAWRSEEHEAVVSIRDTGIGLDPEQLEWIFEPFARASTTERGLGVGLMVVRALVHLHGGTVHARSAGRGHGSEFVVHLPLAASREQLKD